MAEEEEQNAESQDVGAEDSAGQAAEEVAGGASEGAVGEADSSGLATDELSALNIDTDGEPANTIDMLKDVELNVKIELGRAEMTVNEILHLTNGSVVELDKLAGDPVDILVNEKLVARGEVLVVNENFCVRVNEIVAGATEHFAKDTI
ncbi:MAG: flagellar motor switch protein FliN [Sedimentisphaerales bacterium]|nr:flagellar motor switch protein FliN [Sedimentisphaerales bacterium]